MEKYENVSLDNMSRTKKNQSIYNSTDMSKLSRIKTNTNVSVISDAPKEIDIEKIKNYIYSMNEETERKRVSLELPKEEEVVVERKEVKDYDINSVLERARDKRETDYEDVRLRRINNTQIDILKDIRIREEEAAAAVDDDITGPIDELNTEEKTIVDLIQDIQKHGKGNKKELFEDLMAGDDETSVLPAMDEEDEISQERAEVTTEAKDDVKDALINITRDIEALKLPESEFTHEINIEKEALKQIKRLDETEEIEEPKLEETDTDAPRIKEIDKSFYTNSMTFNKSDFEGFEDLEKGVKKSGFLTKLAIVFIVLLLLGTIFLILNFAFNWNII